MYFINIQFTVHVGGVHSFVTFSCIQTIRYFRSSPMNLETDGEQRLTDILIEKLSPSYIQVRDISG